MSDHAPAPAGGDALDDEYDELVHLIVETEWNPGDLVHTATGLTWQFRVTPYTSDFPDVSAGPRRRPGQRLPLIPSSLQQGDTHERSPRAGSRG